MRISALRRPGKGGIIKEAAALTVLAAAVLMPKAAAEGALYGVRLCLSSVIPPFFMLLFAVVLINECGLSARISRILSPLCAKVFGMSGCAAAALISSLIGGYPAGAKTAAELYDKGMVSKEEAQRITLFCFGAGPAFILGTIGRLVPSSSALLLLAVQPVVMTVTGMALRLNLPARTRRDVVNAEEICPPASKPFSECVISASDKTSSALLNICQYVILFAAVRSMLESCGVISLAEYMLRSAGFGDRLSAAVLPMLLEVTGGITPACAAGLPAAAFALGFGGFAVHMQIYGICRDIGVDPVQFTLTRLACGLLSAALTALLARILPGTVVASNMLSEGFEHRLTAGSSAGAVTLFIMCIMLILCSEENNKLSGKNTFR